MSIDETVAVVGSCNVDIRSFAQFRDQHCAL
jgi:phosphatidylserine/phosphatidylglycerophosphate/cardiolipin synthase-like enzyme